VPSFVRGELEAMTLDSGVLWQLAALYASRLLLRDIPMQKNIMSVSDLPHKTSHYSSILLRGDPFIKWREHAWRERQSRCV
jgi:hypothetical protein